MVNKSFSEKRFETIAMEGPPEIPRKRSVGGQPGNRNALKTGSHTREANERYRREMARAREFQKFLEEIEGAIR
jgi:hypothetical protein